MDERVGRVLREVWGSTEGYVFLPQKNKRGWSEQESATWPNDLWLNSVEPHPSIDHYFCPLVFAEPYRRKEHALPTHVLWADLDEADPRTCALRPSIAWITTQGGITTEGVFGHTHGGARDSQDTEMLTEYDDADCPACNPVEVKPHWQALWLLGDYKRAHDNFPHERFDYPQCPGCIDAGSHSVWAGMNPVHRLIPAAEAAELSKRIAYAEPGADRSGWDVTQVLRLPGTYNHKHDPPQRIELLWAKRLYYTIEQIKTAYPPVPRPSGSDSNGASGWHEFTADEIAAALANLPVGVQMALTRDNAGADRSLELLRLARELLRFGVSAAMVPHLLMASPLNKFAGRADEHERLLTAVADALQSATQ